MDHVNPVCSVPSEEVLLSVDLITTSVVIVVVVVVPFTLLREEIRVLLSATTVEILVVLMSMETSIVASQLCVILHTVVELTESVLLIGASVVTSVVALILLHGQMSVLCSRDILSGHLVIVTSKLIESFLVEVVSLRIKEVTTRQDIETILVVFTRSVLNLLSGVLLDSRC